jgi:hypothetical protein
MKHPENQSSPLRCGARVISTLKLLVTVVFASSSLFSIGCDMGTYDDRLNERPVAPVVETQADDTDVGTDETTADETADN